MPFYHCFYIYSFGRMLHSNGKKIVNIREFINHLYEIHKHAYECNVSKGNMTYDKCYLLIITL